MNSIHRMLLTRLAVVTAVITLVVSISVYHFIGYEIDKWVVADAIDDFRKFSSNTMTQLDTPDLGDHGEFQRAIDNIPALATQMKTGKFVILRIFSKEGQEIAGMVDSSYPHIADINNYSANLINWWLVEKGPQHEVLRIGGRMVIRIAFPLSNTSGEVPAYGETYFAVSDETMEKASQVIIRSTAVAVSIVLLTAIVLYPIIMRLVKRLEALSIMLLTANLNILKALGSAVAKRDSGTDAHNYRVTIYAVRLAEAIGLDNESIRVLIKGAFLHDVGKIGIKDFILHKPGRLTVEEYDEMKLHVSHGLDIIRSSEWLDDAAAVVGGHHEKYDGSGYDREVAGVDIPIIARIFSIVDVFDALTSARPYKGPMSYEETMNILNKGRGKDFDPELLDAFSSIAGEIYDKYAGGGGSPEDEVIAIEKKYFISDIAQYLR